MSESDPMAERSDQNWHLIQQEFQRIREEREDRTPRPYVFYLGIAWEDLQTRLENDPTNAEDLRLEEALNEYVQQLADGTYFQRRLFAQGELASQIGSFLKRLEDLSKEAPFNRKPPHTNEDEDI